VTVPHRFVIALITVVTKECVNFPNLLFDAAAFSIHWLCLWRRSAFHFIVSALCTYFAIMHAGLCDDWIAYVDNHQLQSTIFKDLSLHILGDDYQAMCQVIFFLAFKSAQITLGLLVLWNTNV